jgi:hypothetical protein
MAVNITIVPSNSIFRTPDRIPYIDFINSASIRVKMLTTGTLTFGSSPSLSIRDAEIGGNIINVKNNYTTGGVQVLDGTLDWIGSYSGITGPQGAQGVPGADGPQGNTGHAGAQGAQGAQGAIGFQGVDGPPG